MTVPKSNYVASLYSLMYSAKEASKGSILRHVSTVGYTAKVIQKLSKDDSFVLGRVAKSTCDILSDASKDNKLLQLAGKGINLAKHTDGISCLCSMINVAKSDSPARRFIQETISLGGMFIAEDLMLYKQKSIANIKGIKQLNDGMTKFCKNTKYCSQIPAIVYATLYTVGSDIAGNLCWKAGKWIADKLGLAPETPEPPKAEKPKKEYYWG